MLILDKKINWNIKRYKKLVVVVIIIPIIFSLLFLGCSRDDTSQEESKDIDYIQPLEIVGDVEDFVSIENINDISDTVSLEHREEELEALPLNKLLDKSQPYTEDFKVLYVSHDGFSASISSDNLDECYIAFTQENGWEAINNNHPVSSNIKDIESIAVVANNLSLEDGFNIIKPGENITSISPGEIYKNGYHVSTMYRGSSSVSQNGEDLEASTFNRKKIIDIENYVTLDDSDEIIVVGKKGEVENYRQDGTFVLNKNNIGYMAGDDIEIDQAAGIVLDPPDKMITEVYHDSKELLTQDEQVLLILIDGLGYHQYEYAIDNGYAPFLKELPAPEKAMVTYPPVTPVNVASSLTGELPHINGVYKRGIRRTEVPTIFGYCEDHGKKSTAIIGPKGTIELEIDPILSMDGNDDGSTDYEKTENALNEMSKDYDLMFVHYKDVDIVGHDYGDMAEETMEAIAWNDKLVEELVTTWEGKVIIYADHGMHETEEGGDHNSLMTEDMFMPYWKFDGGEIND
ncbi:alkaline phosphatase family protein [Natranaerobius thermophilus]|uniref:Metalloenzyme domain protein n=1 Tax=Natranaerobius thermophilus (strain ATCC BAA-1301 / DSM 18059 / JW/NM-WN-LF) TaxID=457570 RepID=B2A596_NATTJ|nr:alkaline phosphatase family protein [Natranaerobius thermophilus]ACB83930.1 metalloenzyme domain protein [Natranaerobius thermophilus JW/NM-WN-LF]